MKLDHIDLHTPIVVSKTRIYELKLILKTYLGQYLKYRYQLVQWFPIFLGLQHPIIKISGLPHPVVNLQQFYGELVFHT